jgi:hypothetical protein
MKTWRKCASAAPVELTEINSQEASWTGLAIRGTLNRPFQLAENG